MISGFSNERVSYNVRYLNYPSTLSDNMPAISKPTLNVIKIRFNNVFKNEKVLFGFIAVSLSLFSLLAGYALYSMYLSFESPAEYATEELVPANFATDEAGLNGNVLNKVGMSQGAGTSASGSQIGFNNGGAGSNGAFGTISPAEEKSIVGNKKVLSSKKVVVNIDDQITANPFLPAGEGIKKVKKSNPYYILPPENIYEHSGANVLTKTVISGILFDKYSPSAIINIDGSDYLVKKGDVIKNYKIIGIDNEQVTVQFGPNVFRAQVGELLSNENVKSNIMPNLNKRFGGASGVDNIAVKTKRR